MFNEHPVDLHTPAFCVKCYKNSMPTNNEKIEEYIEEFEKKFLENGPLLNVKYLNGYIDTTSDKIKDFLRSTLSSHAAFIEGELAKDFITSGERTNLIELAKKFPETVGNCLDSAYLHGLESAQTILRKQVEGMKKKVVIDGSTSGKFANGLMDNGYNHALDHVLLLLANPKNE